MRIVEIRELDLRENAKSTPAGKTLGWAVLSSVAVGVVAGLVAALPWEKLPPWAEAHPVVAAVLLGIAVSALFHAAWWFRDRIPYFARLSSVTVSLPGGAGSATFTPTAAERKLLWRFFLELSTRITTQILRSGNLREALTSIYGMFQKARDDLANLDPRIVENGDTPARIYVLAILNQELRCFLSRWHPRLSAWEKTGRPESEWPLEELCRRDLEVMRRHVVNLAWDLGTGLGYSRVEGIVGAKVAGWETEKYAGDEELAEKEKEIAAKEESLRRHLPSDGAERGWRIYLEARTRIATQPLMGGLLSAAIASLHALFGIVRDELKGITSLPHVLEGPTVEAIGLRILNVHLRPVLAKWHPELAALEKAEASKAEWPRAEECRADIEKMRAGMENEIAALGRLLGSG